MAQASSKFQAELSRISEGRQESWTRNEQLADRCKELEALLEQSEKQREIANLEIDRLERVIEKISEENHILTEELREKTLEVSKVHMDEKYRRALVYIDALQSKLHPSSTPRVRSQRIYN